MNTLRWVLLLIGALAIAGMLAWEWLGRRRAAAARRQPLQPEAGDEADWFDSELDRLGSLVEETRHSTPTWDEAWALDNRAPAAADAEWPQAEIADPEPDAWAQPELADAPEPAAPAAVDPFSPVEAAAPAEAAPDAQAAAAEREYEPAAGTSGACVLAVHVAVSPNPDPADWLAGQDVVAALERHGFEYGPRALYHWKVAGASVFSVANMIEPGWLDREDLLHGTHRTPGILLLLPLPGPVAGTRAVDDLLAQARRLAHDLDAQLLDVDRQPLSLETMEDLFRRAAPYGGRAAREQRTP